MHRASADGAARAGGGRGAGEAGRVCDQGGNGFCTHVGNRSAKGSGESVIRQAETRLLVSEQITGEENSKLWAGRDIPDPAGAVSENGNDQVSLLSQYHIRSRAIGAEGTT